MHWVKNCDCDRHGVDPTRIIEFFKISESRTELRCSKCKGLMGWWDEPSRAKKIRPEKREWSHKQRLFLR